MFHVDGAAVDQTQNKCQVFQRSALIVFCILYYL